LSRQVAAYLGIVEAVSEALFSRQTKPTTLGSCWFRPGQPLPVVNPGAARRSRISTAIPPKFSRSACGMSPMPADSLKAPVTERDLVHLNDSSVLTALSGATKIRVGKLDGPKGEEEFRAWYWGRKDTLIDISPLCAADVCALGAQSEDG
jgi:hypothetical protein